MPLSLRTLRLPYAMPLRASLLPDRELVYATDYAMPLPAATLLRRYAILLSIQMSLQAYLPLRCRLLRHAITPAFSLTCFMIRRLYIR